MRRAVTLTMSSWSAMIARCCSPSHTSYADYGGRGVAVCERWRHSFSNFLEDMGDRPSERHSIDRIDNNGNYEPSNCRWATTREQRRNSRQNRLLTFNGETLIVSDMAAKYGLKTHSLFTRLRLGWSLEKALLTPIDKNWRKHKTRIDRT